MTADTAYAKLIRATQEAGLLESCAELLAWDEDTCMPAGGVEHRGRQMALLAGLVHDRWTDDDARTLVDGVARCTRQDAGLLVALVLPDGALDPSAANTSERVGVQFESSDPTSLLTRRRKIKIKNNKHETKTSDPMGRDAVRGIDARRNGAGSRRAES